MVQRAVVSIASLLTATVISADVAGERLLHIELGLEFAVLRTLPIHVRP